MPQHKHIHRQHLWHAALEFLKHPCVVQGLPTSTSSSAVLLAMHQWAAFKPH
jgi:hypothetical protein